jgi:hypothetical protein
VLPRPSFAISLDRKRFRVRTHTLAVDVEAMTLRLDRREHDNRPMRRVAAFATAGHEVGGIVVLVAPTVLPAWQLSSVKHDVGRDR